MVAYASYNTLTGISSSVPTTVDPPTIPQRPQPIVVFGVLATVIGVGTLLLTASILKLTYLAHCRAIHNNRYVVSSGH